MMHALTNNYWLEKWDTADSDLCTFGEGAKKKKKCYFGSANTWRHFGAALKTNSTRNIVGPLNLNLITCSRRNAHPCTLFLLTKR